MAVFFFAFIFPIILGLVIAAVWYEVRLRNGHFDIDRLFNQAVSTMKNTKFKLQYIDGFKFDPAKCELISETYKNIEGHTLVNICDMDKSRLGHGEKVAGFFVFRDNDTGTHFEIDLEARYDFGTYHKITIERMAANANSVEFQPLVFSAA